LSMITLTTRGSDLTIEEAHNSYLEWTNRLLTALRKDAKRTSQLWCYVTVTEHQKRGHPHSHMITTYSPTDLKEGQKLTYDKKSGRWEYVDALVSHWLEERCISAGMGEQYDVSPIRSIVGAAKYTAKYLFKSIKDGGFPKDWKRIRYSHSFPKLGRVAGNSFALIRREDWAELDNFKGSWTCYDQYSYDRAMLYSSKYIRLEVEKDE